MSIIAKKEKRNFNPAPEGLWPAVCLDAIDVGMKDTQFGPKHQVAILWQLEERDPEWDKRYQVRKYFTLSLHEKSGLSRTLESWRGKKFSEQEREGFDVESVIGKCCQIQIMHNAKDDGQVFANIQAVVPYPKELPVLRVEDYVRVTERTALPEKSQDQTITDSDIPF